MRFSTGFSVVLLAFSAPPGIAQATHDPNAARLVTSDITNFWRAYDRAQLASTDQARIDAYYDLYVRPGSPGLHDFIRTRLSSGYGLVDLLVAKGWSAARLESGAPPTDAERARLDHDTTGIGERIAAWNNSQAAEATRAQLEQPEFRAEMERLPPYWVGE